MIFATADECQSAKGFGAVDLGLQTLGKLARFIGAEGTRGRDQNSLSKKCGSTLLVVPWLMCLGALCIASATVLKFFDVDRGATPAAEGWRSTLTNLGRAKLRGGGRALSMGQERRRRGLPR